MYKLRRATADDLDVVATMASTFYSESGYEAMGIPKDDDSLRKFARTTLDSGFIVLAEVETTQEVVGMLGILMVPFSLNSAYTVAAENAWWVHPDHRRSKVGPALLEYGKVFAKLKGANLWNLSVLSTTPDGVEAFLVSQGLSKVESAFMGVL